jgi:hypothetical protein
MHHRNCQLRSREGSVTKHVGRYNYRLRSDHVETSNEKRIGIHRLPIGSDFWSKLSRER